MAVKCRSNPSGRGNSHSLSFPLGLESLLGGEHTCTMLCWLRLYCGCRCSACSLDKNLGVYVLDTLPAPSSLLAFSVRTCPLQKFMYQWSVKLSFMLLGLEENNSGDSDPNKTKNIPKFTSVYIFDLTHLQLTKVQSGK